MNSKIILRKENESQMPSYKVKWGKINHKSVRKEVQGVLHRYRAHKKYSQITIMKENGKIINGHKVNNDRKSIKRTLRLYAKDGSKAVLESGWDWGLLYDMVSDCVDEVKITHPLKVKAIA